MPEIRGLFPRPVSFQGLLDEIPMGAMILDRDRRILFLNRAMEALTGFEGQDACGIRCANILRNAICMEGCPLENEAFQRAGAPACLDGNIVNRERKKIPVRITVVPVVDLAGGCCGYLETVEDLRLSADGSWKTDHAYGFGHLIGNSPQMIKIFQTLPMVGQTESSVLITGETGTGKDLIAEAIHLASDRCKGTFIKVNCGALPETLLESELFGHQKGAFTGAAENKPGRFKLAHNGTLFLTEIGDLPLGLQTKLLTFLDDKTIFPLGSTQGVKVNVRIIAATLRNLEAMVRSGQFRSDLLFRLNVIRIHLPPLRDREGDVRLLLDQYLRTFSEQAKKKITGFASNALDVLLAYAYPGNVRELKNIVEYAVTFCMADTIEREHLPDYLRRKEPGARADEPHAARLVSAVDALESEYGCEGGVPDGHGCNPFPGTAGTWKELEKKMILDALRQAKGRRSRAAEALGWGRSTLWRKMKALGLDS
mgnify:CR=1 FL=1